MERIPCSSRYSHPTGHVRHRPAADGHRPPEQVAQAERDRQATGRDRRTSVRTQADTEHLARELAAIRLALGEMPTRDYLDEELERSGARVDPGPGADPGVADKERPSGAAGLGRVG